MDPIVEVIVAVVSAVFSSGVAYGAMRGQIKVAQIESSTAKQQADEALRRCGKLETQLANERTERVRVEGQYEKLQLEVSLREEFRRQNDVLDGQTALLEAMAKRPGSVPRMSASRAIPREEPPSDPPEPTTRPKLPSRGRFGAE